MGFRKRNSKGFFSRINRIFYSKELNAGGNYFSIGQILPNQIDKYIFSEFDDLSIKSPHT